MLAAERKPEMGIARAVGTERVHLVEMFMFEGLLYDIVAALVGALTGVLVALGMVSVLAVASEEFGVDIRFNVSTRSIITAYAMGVVLTFIVVTASAWRVSLLNIVTAIRNLPEPVTRVRGRASFVWGVVFLVLGALITYAGLSSHQGTPFYFGVSLLIFSAIPISRSLGAPDRLAFSVAGALIVVLWLLPWRLVETVAGELGSDINIWVVGGLITVIGVTWLVMYNSDVVVDATLATLGRVRGLAPTLKTALTYPLMNRFRTGVTLAMFTLVVFTLVVGGTVTTAFTDAFDDEELFGGGFEIRAETVQVNPVTDLEAEIAQEPSLDPADFNVVAAQSLVPIEAAQPPGGESRDDIARRLYQAEYSALNEEQRLEVDNTYCRNGCGDYPLRGLSDDFFDHTTYGMSVMADGYESAEEVWQAVKNDPSLAVVDSLVAPRRSNFGFGAPVPDFTLEGFYIEDGRMQPTTIELRNPLTGETFRVTVIGVLTEVIPEFMIGVTTSQRFVETAFPDQATPTAHLIALDEGADVETVASALESAFLDHGMEAVVLSEELEDLVAVNRMFNYLIQGFIGLGLVVGVAALGVVSARTVVERRQEIGVMRAIGFEQGRVQLGFLIESSMIAVAGIVVGTILGLILAYNIIDDSSRQASWTNIKFAVPWLNLAIIYVVVLAAALVTAYLPALQASRVYPAQALRYE
jgi:putative ABC transport system permease protein